ncbi:MAG: TIGR02450 family Trp-rich protein [Pseudoalteromonas sp.]|uniref:TIGR02450 family Trp-rich protein n=1 Tax=unclassified Pseudoalteromonas TaxID=194690 RepID=UPI000C06E5AC|nr:MULTISPECIES: TIGR02450 family Trp-rich protein [unclassified Pseudoalteromonas]MDB2356085.1 TIGR02450 family Trp-rich protein [Pseudoalteromonas sp.]MDP2634887.1 TIGR02450 family Trp-rich protein [Pseudoalteromonas sp. 1_MG-2023]PHN89132.1 TIGR02450 family Trp-rich protein [Pseudoalteromonas sp. 3D05]TGE79991.1 TIGR02450 family Trp-rich protein [Pseudoalteromonas sp. KS88]
MNQINPRKLLRSKWTAVSPINKEKHFIITDIEFDEEGVVIHCEIEAVMSKRTQLIDWRQLKEQDVWLQGWK